MYTEHFGLERAVFDGGIAQSSDLFLGKRQQLIATNLKIGLSTRDSVVTLTGSLGVGKTTLAAQALRITATRMAQTWIGSTSLTPDEMLETLLAGFELEPYDMGRVQRIQTWRQFMGEMSATDKRHLHSRRERACTRVRGPASTRSADGRGPKRLVRGPISF